MTTVPKRHEHQSFWLWVMCLTGVDYFSTLGYQPSIAFEAAGLLAPFATVVLVLVTLFGALPVYATWWPDRRTGRDRSRCSSDCCRAGRRSRGAGAAGFAATDFVITKTLSAADAAVHCDPQSAVGGSSQLAAGRMTLTMFLLILLGAVSGAGFAEVIWVVVSVYLVLNLIVILSSLWYLLTHGEEISQWLTPSGRGNGTWRGAGRNVATSARSSSRACISPSWPWD